MSSFLSRLIAIGGDGRKAPKTGSTPYTAIAHVDQYSWCLNDEDDHDGDDGNDHDNDDDDDHDENDGDDHVCDGKDLKSKQDYLMAKKRGLIEIDPNLNVLRRGEQKYENTAHRWKWQLGIQRQVETPWAHLQKTYIQM